MSTNNEQSPENFERPLTPLEIQTEKVTKYT